MEMRKKEQGGDHVHAPFRVGKRQGAGTRIVLPSARSRRLRE